MLGGGVAGGGLGGVEGGTGGEGGEGGGGGASSRVATFAMASSEVGTDSACADGGDGEQGSGDRRARLGLMCGGA